MLKRNPQGREALAAQFRRPLAYRDLRLDEDDF
jgi:hypothetical protein